MGDWHNTNSLCYSPILGRAWNISVSLTYISLQKKLETLTVNLKNTTQDNDLLG